MPTPFQVGRLTLKPKGVGYVATSKSGGTSVSAVVEPYAGMQTRWEGRLTINLEGGGRIALGFDDAASPEDAAARLSERLGAAAGVLGKLV